MARKLRENIPGGIYHVYARGNARVLIYRDEVDRRIYLSRLGRVATGMKWRCLAYCLMNNHVHLLLETPEPNLSSGMQRLHGSYAGVFNSRHGRCGHLFQGRYGAVRISSDRQLCATAAYLARNPVEAGLCARPEDWPWCSYRRLVLAADHAWLDSRRLLSYFHDEPEVALHRYVQMSQMPAVI